MSTVFANGPGERGSIPGQVIPKTKKKVLDASLLNTQDYKVRIKGKVEQSREWSSTPTLWCSSYWKGSLQVTLDRGRQLYSSPGFSGCVIWFPPTEHHKEYSVFPLLLWHVTLWLFPAPCWCLAYVPPDGWVWHYCGFFISQNEDTQTREVGWNKYVTITEQICRIQVLYNS